MFLTASPQARAHRRALQNSALADAQAPAVDERAVLASILRRDEVDSSRAESPLRAAEDAVMIDSSTCSVDEVAGRVAALIDAALARGEA